MVTMRFRRGKDNEMEWREIDTMMVSRCIQFVEKEINDGKLQASRFIPIPELKESQAYAFYKAWRVHLVDRMMKESDKYLSARFTSNPTKELEDDVRYFKKVQEKERAARTDYDDY
jgi:hypothetical protein